MIRKWLVSAVVAGLFACISLLVVGLLTLTLSGRFFSQENLLFSLVGYALDGNVSVYSWLVYLLVVLGLFVRHAAALDRFFEAFLNAEPRPRLEVLTRRFLSAVTALAASLAAVTFLGFATGLVFWKYPVDPLTYGRTHTLSESAARSFEFVWSAGWLSYLTVTGVFLVLFVVIYLRMSPNRKRDSGTF